MLSLETSWTPLRAPLWCVCFTYYSLAQLIDYNTTLGWSLRRAVESVFGLHGVKYAKNPVYSVFSCLCVIDSSGVEVLYMKILSGPIDCVYLCTLWQAESEAAPVFFWLTFSQTG
jgi:hypothetical protein